MLVGVRVADHQGLKKGKYGHFGTAVDVLGGHSQSRLATPQNAKFARKAHLEENGVQLPPLK